MSALTLAACTDSGSTATPTTNTSSTTATIPGPTPSTTVTPSASSKEQAAADAKAAYLNYRKTVDRVFRSGGKTAEAAFDEIAASGQLRFLLAQAKSLRDDHQHQTGSVAVKSADVRGVDLRGAGRLPQVVLDVCADASGRDVVDERGRSVVPQNRPSLFRQSIILTLFADSRRWLVTGEEDVQVKSC